MAVPSISRDELARLFDLPSAALESLIGAGRLLCHVRDGEQRIPLDQIEAVFRDGLLRNRGT